MKTFNLLMAMGVLATGWACTQGQEFEVGTSTAIYGKTYDVQALEATKAEGVKYLEVTINQSYRGVPAEEVEPRMRSYAAAIDSAGINVWSVHLPFSRTLDISVTDDSLRRENIDLLAGIIRLSAEMYGPQRFVLHPSSEPIADAEREARIECSVASISELKKVADEVGVPLCIENLPRTCLGNTPEELVRIVDSVPGVNVCFDTNHYTRGTMDHFLDVVGERIKTVHISDFDFVDERHWLPYDGQVNWDNFIVDMRKKANYQGVMMFEVKTRKDGTAATPADLISVFNRMNE